MRAPFRRSPRKFARICGTPLAKPLIDRGIAGFGGFAEFFRKDVARIFASIQDAQARQDLAAANEAAAKAMDDLKAWLISERKRRFGLALTK